MENKKIKYKLSEDQKDILRLKLETLLNQEEGEQVIILMDKDGLKDYYQNICISCLLDIVTKSSIDYAKQSNNEFIVDNYEDYLNNILSHFTQFIEKIENLEKRSKIL